jgi:hypothetical protein
MASLVINLYGCDVCGCAISGQQFGILPQFQKHFLGLRYGTRSFQTLHPPVFSTDKSTTSNERFQNIDLWGRMVVSERIQLFGFVPYNKIVKQENETTFTQNGLGDISILGMYAIINQRQSNSLPIIQNLQIGGGVKLPTGTHDALTSDGTYVPAAQLGSGSVDILANLSYIIRYQNIGLSVESSYRHNHSNNLDFQFGHRMTNALRFFYKIDTKDISFLPHGGNGVYGQLGVDVFTSNLALGLQFQPVVFENVGNGNISSNSRFSVQSMYLF